MKRRTFLLFFILGAFVRSFAKGEKADEFKVLKAVFNHLFPKTKKYNGALEFGIINFLSFISKHPTFDKSDMEFLLEGAKEILEQNKEFLSFSTEKKEEILREFETTRYGQNWLSFLIYYGIEAMLGDPIYQGNKNMTGWKNINHTPPIPLAKKAFGK